MTTKAEILRTIIQNCINCVVGAISIIEDCGGEKNCCLYPYRFGVDPKPAKKGKGPSKEVQEKGMLASLQRGKKTSKIDDK